MIRESHDEPDHTFPSEGGELQPDSRISCPYCGADVEILLDTGGDMVQHYVEDCEVCCRPWQVTVRWDAAGLAHVEARTEEE